MDDFETEMSKDFLKAWPDLIQPGIIQKLKTLWVQGIEVTQAIQYYRSSEHLTDTADQGADNGVTLVAHKPAWVRVYVRRRSSVGDIANVTGTIEVSRRSYGVFYGPIATLAPQAPGTVTARYNPAYATERGTLGYTLNFIIPADIMCGNLKLTAKIEAPSGASDDHETYVHATLQQTLSVRGVMVGYNGPASLGPNAPNLTLAAPTLQDLQTTSGWTLLAYPVRSTATYGNAGTITWGTPLTDAPSCSGCCSPNWVALNAAVQTQRVADGNRAGVLYYGLMAPGIPMGPIIGCSGGGTSTGSSGDQVTMAHELGHACGLPHAPCGVAADPTYPVYEPYDTGGTAHAWIGEYGLDISNGSIKPPGTFRDFMSYCGPDWISLYNYGRLLNNTHLNPEIVCEDHPWFLHEKYIRYKPPWPPHPIPEMREPFPVFRRLPVMVQPEHVISIIGVVHAEDRVEVTSVMRVDAVRQVPNGVETPLAAELIGRDGSAVARDTVFRLPLMGNGCGCGCEEPSTYPYTFQAFLSDTETGSALRIRHGEKDLWRREAPDGKPAISSFSAEVDGEGELRASYETSGTGDQAEYWLQWSADRGETWHGLATRLDAKHAAIADVALPAGKVLVRLLVGNGFRTVASKPVPVRVPDRPPVASILSPDDRAVLMAGDPMRVWGVVTDRTGEPADIEHAAWLIDGEEVGAGLDAFIEAPPHGEHRLTLVVEVKGKHVETDCVFATVEMPKRGE